MTSEVTSTKNMEKTVIVGGQKLIFNFYEDPKELDHLYLNQSFWRLPGRDEANDGFSYFDDAIRMEPLDSNKHIHSVAMYVTKKSSLPYMVVALVIERDAKLAYPIGITKNQKNQKEGPHVPRASLMLHAFWAKCVRSMYPEVEIGITWPVKGMLHIFATTPELPIAVGYPHDVQIYASKVLGDGDLTQAEYDEWKADYLHNSAFERTKMQQMAEEDGTPMSPSDDIGIDDMEEIIRGGSIKEKLMQKLWHHKKHSLLEPHPWSRRGDYITFSYANGLQSTFHKDNLQSWTYSPRPWFAFDDVYWIGPAVSFRVADLAALFPEEQKPPCLTSSTI